MSCPPESVALRYADGDLSPDEVRGFESHLVTCRACRTLVVALRDEAVLIGDVLGERTREQRAPARPAAPAPAVTLGLPLAIAAVTLVLAVLGFLIEARLPGAFDLLHPRRLMGASEMIFDLFFLLRDEAPGLVELALSLGVVAAVSALGTFAVGMIYRRVFGPTALALAAALLAQAPEPALALARVFQEEVRVASGETVHESMVISADEIRIEGRIEGDLIAAGEHVSISGVVEGNVYLLGQSTEITGRVEGVVHAIAQDLRVDGEVGGAFYGIGEKVAVGRDGRIGRDMYTIAKSVVLDGEVARDAHAFWGDRAEVRGRVGRNFHSLLSNRVLLRDGSHIGGNVEAQLRRADALTQEEEAVVGGTIEVEEVDYAKEHYLASFRDPAFYGWHAIGFVASFVFGLLLHAFLPRLFDGELTTGRDFLGSMGWGFVVLIVTPVAILVTALTLIGIPIAVLTLFAFITAVYTAELLVGALIGRAIFSPEDDSTYAFGRSYGIGLALVVVVTHLPFLGPPASIVCLLVGMGLLVSHARTLALPRAM